MLYCLSTLKSLHSYHNDCLTDMFFDVSGALCPTGYPSQHKQSHTADEHQCRRCRFRDILFLVVFVFFLFLLDFIVWWDVYRCNHRWWHVGLWPVVESRRRRQRDRISCIWLPYEVTLGDRRTSRERMILDESVDVGNGDNRRTSDQCDRNALPHSSSSLVDKVHNLDPDVGESASRTIYA